MSRVEDSEGNQAKVDEKESNSYELEVNDPDANPDTESRTYRLGGRPPLKTILILSIGPLLTQVVTAVYALVNQVWITKWVGQKGISLISYQISIEGVLRGFGQFMTISGATQLSFLYGQKRFDECEQVVCDIFRCTIVVGAIAALIILLVDPYLLDWYQVTGSDKKESYKYIIPQAAGNFLTCGYLACQGFLQAEGRTSLAGIIDIIAMGCGMFILNPIMVGALKVGIIGQSITQIICDGVPFVVLTILYFRGTFGIKPKPRGLLCRFSKNTYKGLIVGFSQLASQLCIMIPGFFVRSLLTKSTSGDSDRKDATFGGFSVATRWYQIQACVVFGFGFGFVPCGSFAFAAHNIKRYNFLWLHLNWLTAVWCIATSIFLYASPETISAIYGSSREKVAETWGEDNADLFISMISNMNMLNIICFIRTTLQVLLQSQQKGIWATIYSIVNVSASVLVGAFALNAIYPNDPTKIMYTYPASVITALVIGSAMCSPSFYKMWKLRNQTELPAAVVQK